MYHDDVRCGSMRASMRTNCLLTKPELGKARFTIPTRCHSRDALQVKRATTTLPPAHHAYGVKSATNCEGAREGRPTRMPHRERSLSHDDLETARAESGLQTRTRFRSDEQTRDDAVTTTTRETSPRIGDRGIISSKDLRSFRQDNPLTIRRGVHRRRLSTETSLSDRVFGMDSRYRSAEKIRNFGSEPFSDHPSATTLFREKEPFMQHVVQGAFQYDWIRAAQERDQNHRELKMKRPVAPTKASNGHAHGARLFSEVIPHSIAALMPAQMLERPSHDLSQKLFKMKKFKKIQPRIRPLAVTRPQQTVE